MFHLEATDSGSQLGAIRGSGGAALPRSPLSLGQGSSQTPLQSSALSRSGSVPQARGGEGKDDPAELHLSLRAAPALLL